MGESITVFAADNHPVFCAGIAAILAAENDLQLSGTAHDLHQLHSYRAAEPPHVMLLGSGLATAKLPETVTEWKQKFPNSHILLILTDVKEAYLYQLVKQVVAGCLLKTDPVQKFVQAIRAVAQGDAWFSQRLWQTISQPDAVPVPFTELEQTLLPHIVTEMTIEEIALALHMSERTLKRHLQEVYTKLGVKTRVGAAVQITQVGLA